MKKLLLGIFAVLFVLSLSAWHITTTKTKPATKSLTEYTWHMYNVEGTEELVPAVTFFGTAIEAQEEFECPEGTGRYCARAYNGQTALNIYIEKPQP